MKDLKYLFAYLVPLSAFFALTMLGFRSWHTVILAFGVLPLLEIWTPQSKANVLPEQESSRSRRIFFDWLLYLNAPLLFSVIGFYLYDLHTQQLSLFELMGLTFSTGIVVGTCGINVAHELGHRPGAAEQILAKWMLLPTLYQHFFIEHNRGHHKNVATDLDPASARFGESIYAFWIRSIAGGWLGAWKLERDRLHRGGKSAWSWQNEMLRFQVYQFGWLFLVFILFGVKEVIGACAVALIGILLLESVNYLEHYGLRRNKLASGQYEPVTPRHSWNSDHELGRIFLYELTRHSDHHFKATRKYQNLRHMDESPQLPYGYPTSLLMCLVPPLWFRVMNPKISNT
jgi:alkane 1-monooxygenase